MIIYGTRGTRTASETVMEKCPNCGHFGYDIHVFQKYVHIFWIPFFPINRTGAAHCTSCGHAWEKKQMPESMKAAYQNVRVQAKRPLWTFTGVAIAGALITWGVILANQEDAENRRLIQQPVTGDVFEFRTESGQYTLLRVTDIQGDKVFLQPHSYETNKVSGLIDMREKGETAWLQDTLLFTTTELITLQKDGSIIDIDRKPAIVSSAGQ